MANALTGGFDAVIQIAVSQINGILATLHQNGASATTTLKLLHEVRTRVGDPGRGRFDPPAFGEWLVEYQEARPAAPRRPVRDLLVGQFEEGRLRIYRNLGSASDPTFDAPIWFHDLCPTGLIPSG